MQNDFAKIFDVMRCGKQRAQDKEVGPQKTMLIVKRDGEKAKKGHTEQTQRERKWDRERELAGKMKSCMAKCDVK